MDQSKLTWSAFAISAIAFTASIAGVATSRDLLQTQNTIGDSGDSYNVGVGGESQDTLPGEPDLGLEMGPPPVCPATKGGGGFGGNHVSCRFPCVHPSFLHIEVTSADTVMVSGSGSCGGAGVSCTGKQTCTGVSKRATRYSDDNGSCTGNSDETWKSSLTVDCWATPGCTNPLECAAAGDE